MWSVEYRASAAGPKTASCVPSSSDGEPEGRLAGQPVARAYAPITKGSQRAQLQQEGEREVCPAEGLAGHLSSVSGAGLSGRHYPERPKNRVWMAIPASIAATKAKTEKRPVLRAATAGPGQKPTRPQPTPKRAEPPSRGASITFFSGRES